MKDEKPNHGDLKQSRALFWERKAIKLHSSLIGSIVTAPVEDQSWLNHERRQAAKKV